MLKDGAVQEAGRTATVFRLPGLGLREKAPCRRAEPQPDRYAVLREAGFGGARPARSRRSRVSAVTKTFAADGGSPGPSTASRSPCRPGTTHALVGESGSGKTTAIRLLLGLETPDAGSIQVAGQEVAGRSHEALRSVRRQLQLVYQNPFTSLDPTWSVDALVREPLDGSRSAPAGSGPSGSARCWPMSGSGPISSRAGRMPCRAASASGGGDRPGAGAETDVIVLDEPTSALDVSVQADIVEVLLSLQATLGLTYVFVSHDLALCASSPIPSRCDAARGASSRRARVADIFEDPRHPYTAALLDAGPDRARGPGSRAARHSRMATDEPLVA